MSSTKPSNTAASGSYSGPIREGDPGRVVFFDSPEDTACDMLQQFHKSCAEAGVDVSPGELDELAAFRSFLASHVKRNRIRDVPCMLLWAEWVRYFLKQMRSFPGFIREKEFMDMVVNISGFEVAADEERGKVFPGICFIPHPEQSGRERPGSAASA